MGKNQLPYNYFYVIPANSRSRRRSLQRSSKRNSRRSRAATPVSNRSSNLGSMGSHEFSTSTTTTPTFGETRIKKDRSRVWGSFLRTSFRLSIGSYDASEKGPQSTRSGVSMTKIDEEDGIPDIAEKASHSGDAPNVTQILEDDDDDNGEFDADIDECNASVAQSIVKSIAASLTTFDRRRAVHGAGSIDFTSIDQADDVDRSANNGVAMLGEHADDILRLISASQDAYAQPSPSPVDKIRRGLKPIDTSQFQKIDEDSPQDDSNNDFEPSYSRLANNSAFTRNLPTDTKANLMYDSSNSDSFLDSGSFRQDPRNLSTGAISLPVRKNRRTSNSIKALDDTISLSSRKKPRFSSSKSSLYGIRYNLSNISGDFSSRIGKIFPTITIDDEEFIKYAERVVESAQNDVVDLATNIAGSTKGNVRRHSMDEWNYEDVSSTEVLKSIEEAFGTRNSDNYDTTYDLSQDDSIHVHRDN